mgnify:CR=1 FL=1
MAAITGTIDTGQERHETVWTTGGSTTKALTVIISTTQCVDKREALALLQKVMEDLAEGAWPPVAAS